MRNNKPIIGIVARPDSDGKNNVLVIMESYRNAIIYSGGNPVMILPTQLVEYGSFSSKEVPAMSEEEKQMLDEQLQFCDGILMPGGLKRYEYDFYIANYCIERDIPILGICLGMQILATHINRDALEFTEPKLSHNKPDIDEVHFVKLDKGSKLFSIIGEEELLVNSRHKQKVTEAGSFKVVGISSDGVIEAIENINKKFAIGVQWHPENIMHKESSKKLFKKFIESARH
ncbi:MAG: gamma-glutamyl-gamma-aminobutyrate hydrolase family protein [Bacilli bacterium]|nr:gamma-glutamyl-gamma-aminobutyrate hydrolase family protein [Bacilli bacterium]